MSEPTIQSLNNKITVMNSTLIGLLERIKILEINSAIFITSSELKSEITSLEDKVADINTSINTLETKLQRIILPADTRYYLKESEITDFRNHFRQLRAFMSEIDNTRTALIRLASRYNLTNSQL